MAVRLAQAGVLVGVLHYTLYPQARCHAQQHHVNFYKAVNLWDRAQLMLPACSQRASQLGAWSTARPAKGALLLVGAPPI